MRRSPFTGRAAGALLGAAVALGGAAAPALALAAPAPVTQTANQATFGDLIAALNNINAQIGNLSALNGLTVQGVQLVSVNDTLNGNNVQALDNALNRNTVQVVYLQNVLNNPSILNNVSVLDQALTNNQVKIGQVVAVDVLSGGPVIVFYQ